MFVSTLQQLTLRRRLLITGELAFSADSFSGRLFQPLEELSGVGRETVDVAPLAAWASRTGSMVPRQRGLAPSSPTRQGRFCGPSLRSLSRCGPPEIMLRPTGESVGDAAVWHRRSRSSEGHRCARFRRQSTLAADAVPMPTWRAKPAARCRNRNVFVAGSPHHASATARGNARSSGSADRTLSLTVVTGTTLVISPVRHSICKRNMDQEKCAANARLTFAVQDQSTSIW